MQPFLFLAEPITDLIKTLVTKAVDLFKKAAHTFADKAIELIKVGAAKVGDALKKAPAAAATTLGGMCSVMTRSSPILI